MFNVDVTTAWARSDEVLACGFEGELELETLGTLKVTNHFEQIARMRIPVRTEHAHQAFGRSFRDATEFLKPNRRIDVVAQNRFSSIEISGQERFHASTEECLQVFAVLPDTRLPVSLNSRVRGIVKSPAT